MRWALLVTRLAVTFLATVHTYPRFRYPVVMALPIVLLVVGGYLAWALTEPLDPD